MTLDQETSLQKLFKRSDSGYISFDFYKKAFSLLENSDILGKWAGMKIRISPNGKVEYLG